MFQTIMNVGTASVPMTSRFQYEIPLRFATRNSKNAEINAMNNEKMINQNIGRHV